MSRLLRACMALSLVISCTAPTDPSHALLSSLLPAGTYRIGVSPLVSPSTLKCSDSDRYIGVTVQSFVTVTHEGSVLIARSTTPDNGDVEVRIAVSGTRFSATLVAGTARGIVIDRRDEESVGLSTLTFAGADGQDAALTGTLFTAPTSYLGGAATGTFIAQSILGTETCQHAQWGLLQLEQ